MSIPIGVDEPLERLPGDFARHPHTGAPYVADPERTRQPTGKKDDLLAKCHARGIEVPAKVTVAQLRELLGPEPRMVQYGRPSSLGKQIENTTNLQKWAERAVALGVLLGTIAAVKEHDLLGKLVELGEDHWNLDDPDARVLLDEIAVKAKQIAQAGIAAERGTHTHALTEDADTERDWIERARKGEDLGLPQLLQQQFVDAWERMLADEALDILAVEQTVVDDIWRQAGTLDRVARLGRDRTFTIAGGETVTIPAGWVGVLDVKTGRLRLGSDGHPDHWHGYAVQIASYAQAVPYDTETDTRGAWEWEIDQRWGMIAHLDIAHALATGEVACNLHLVDLEAGREAGALCVAARQWERRRNVFSLALPPQPAAAASSPAHEDAATAPAAAEDTPQAEIPQPTDPAPAGSSESSAAAHAGDPALELAELIVSWPRETREQIARHWRPGIPTPGAVRRREATWTAKQIAGPIRDALNDASAPFNPYTQPTPPAPERTPAPTPARPRKVDDGGPIDDRALETLLRTIKASPYREHVNRWLREAADADCGWSPRVASTVRNFEIARAAHRLAEAVDGDDTYAWLILGHVIPGAERGSEPVGVVLGGLSIIDARQVHELADAFGNTLTLTFLDDGTPRLEGDVAAVLAAAA